MTIFTFTNTFLFLQVVAMANICTLMRRSSSWAVTCAVRWWSLRGIKGTRYRFVTACICPTETPVLMQCSPLQVMLQHKYTKTTERSLNPRIIQFLNININVIICLIWNIIMSINEIINKPLHIQYLIVLLVLIYKGILHYIIYKHII